MKRLLLWLFLTLFATLNAQVHFQASSQAASIRNSGGRITTASHLLVDGKDTLLCSQQPDMGAFMEVAISQSDSIVRLDQAVAGRFEAEIYLPKDANIRAFRMRVQDAQGETFQLPFNQDLSKLSGWQTLTADVDFTKPNKNSWGSAKNSLYDLPLRFSTIAASPVNPKLPRSLAIRRLAFVPIKAVPNFALDTNCPVHVLRPEDDDRLALVITNTCEVENNIHGSYTVTDAWQQQLHRHDFSYTIPARQSVRLPLAAPKALGIFYVNINGTSGELPFQKQLSFARMTPAGPTLGRSSGFIFGVQSHALRYNEKEQHLDALAAALMGAKVYRTSSNWYLAQPRANRPPDFSAIDKMFDIYEAQGLEPQICFLSTPKWAVDPAWKPFSADYVNRLGSRGLPAPDLNLYQNYVEQFMSRYRGRVRFVESWNEPDLLSFANFPADTYVDIMKRFYASVKKTAPEAWIMTGGYTSIRQPYPRRSTHPDHMAYTMEKAKGHYDIHAFHAHGPFGSFAPQIVQLHEMQRRIGVNIPWWANETAETSSTRGETVQASTLFKKFLYTFAMNGIGYTWYDLRNDGYDPKEPEHNYGLITRDFYPKAAYATYNTLATLFTHAAFLKTLGDTPDFHAYLFKAHNGDFLIPCWNTREFAPGKLLTLTNITGKLSTIDIFGNETPVETQGGIAFIDSTSWPLTIRLTGQHSFPNLLQRTFVIPQQYAIHPTRENHLPLSFTNPHTQPLEVTLNIKPTPGLKLDKLSHVATIAPGETHTFMVSMHTTGKSLPAQPALNIDFQLGKLLTQKHTIPLKSVSLMPTSFTVKSAHQARQLVVNAPDLAHLIWKGPEDCSATATLNSTDDALTFDFTVTDDIHVQPFSGFDVWKADNIQIALKFPQQSDVWEIGLTHLANGKSECYTFKQPKDTPKNATAQFRLQTERNEQSKTTSYKAQIPLAALGLKAQDLELPFAFNFIVNDNDTDCRETILFLTPGLGTGVHRPDLYKLIAK